MDVAILVGNGFDLNLGLATSFRSFYEEYSKLHNSDLLSKELNDCPETWGDLEIEFGKLARLVTKKEDIASFKISKTIIEMKLVEYLKKEQARLIISDAATLSQEVERQIQNIADEFKPVNRRYYTNNLVLNSAKPINYRFVSFNYTNTLDRILSTVTSGPSAIHLSHRCMTSPVSDRIELPFHVHGTLDGDLVMGVGDRRQINSDEFRGENDLANYLVKKETNDNLATNAVAEVERIVSLSTVVILFGMSISPTDNYWWHYLAKWLAGDEARRIVVYRFDQRGISPLGSETLSRQKEITDRLLEGYETRSGDDSSLRTRISVVVNSNLFKFHSIVISPRT
jgi:hypothetical protein